MEERPSVTRGITVSRRAQIAFCLFWMVAQVPSTAELLLYEFEQSWPVQVNSVLNLDATSLYADRDGHVYVLSSYIYKMDSTGRWLQTWNPGGSYHMPAKIYTPRTISEQQGVAVDQAGQVYLAASFSINVYSPEGVLLATHSFLNPGSPPDQLNAADIVVDGLGYMYVTDHVNDKIFRVKPSGSLLSYLGSPGTGSGQFNMPTGIAMDVEGVLYVVDKGNNRIQKLERDGTFLTSWGTLGNGDGQFSAPQGIAIGSIGNVYVADTGNNRIQCFDSSGAFQFKWGIQGSGPGEFNSPEDVTVDDSGFVYVIDGDNFRIQKFTKDGAFVTSWSRLGFENGTFHYPYGVALDSADNVYVTERDNHRVQKFDSSGAFITKWGSFGTGDGQFNEPFSIAIDGSDNVYVLDKNNHRVQKFTSVGGFLLKWGSFGTADGEFAHPEGIAVDSAGNVYVSDTTNDRVQKFDSAGNFIMKWGTEGPGDGQFRNPKGIDVDAAGANVFVVDGNNNRVQKFTNSGAFVTKWGQLGAEAGDFDAPVGLALDDADKVYVLEPSSGNRIQKFEPNGTYITQWGDRGPGSSSTASLDNKIIPGIFYSPWDLEVSSTGDVYVSDVNNHRMQKFKPVSGTDITIGIVVLGGGHYNGNRLWGATQSNGGLACWAMAAQGIHADRILLMTPGFPTTMAGALSQATAYYPSEFDMSQIVNDIAAQWPGIVKNAVVYLVDHGAPGRFRLNEDTILEDSQLASWIDDIQEQISGTLTVVYDACESGTFISALANPTYAGKRIVIAATSAGEQAHFVENGLLSFSNHFWSEVLNGETVGESFERAKTAMSWANQNPILDDNSDGTGDGPANHPLADVTHIGSGTSGNFTPPVHTTTGGAYSGVNDGTVFVDGVSDDEGVVRAWAIVTPPTLTTSQAPSTMAVIHRSEVELLPDDDDSDRWEGTYTDFVTPGVYSVDVFLLDAVGALSGPFHTTVTVGNPPTRKVILVAAGDPASQEWPAYVYTAGWAYAALRIQGYTDDDIRFFSQATGAGVDDSDATLAEVNDAIVNWAATNTRDLTICFIGQGVLGGIWINQSEFLEWTSLGTALDAIRDNIPGMLTVYCDADGAGSLLPQIAPPPEHPQIVVTGAGAGQSASFANGGITSFSRHFWVETAFGATVAGAFQKAAGAMKFATGQTGELDDNGDGVYDSKVDGTRALRYTIGNGVGLAGDEPVIGDISGDQTLFGAETSATFGVGPVSSLLAMQEVVATITPPDGGAPFDVSLGETFPGEWEATYDGFTKTGVYRISVTAVDIRDIASAPKETRVTKQTGSGDGADTYEDDDAFGNAKWIGVDAFPDQVHNFHDNGDIDWATFHANSGDVITVETNNLGENVDTHIQVFRADGATQVAENDDRPIGDVSSSATFTVDTTAFYLAKVFHSADSDLPGFGTGSNYDLRVWRQTGPALPGNLMVTVLNGLSQGVANATITLNSTTPPWNLQQPVHSDGTYSFTGLGSGSYQVAASAPGFGPSSPVNVFVSAGGSANQVITLSGQTGGITCTIEPAGAVAAGAQWRVDGGAFQNSGATVSGLTAGAHSVTFKDIAGWVTPAGANVTVNPNQTASAGGTYTPAQLATPQGLQASDGTFADRVEVTWQAVPNATGYRVYRSQSWDGSTATAIGDVAGTTFNDTTAATPNVVTPPSGCGGGGGTPVVTYVTYVYWIQALGAGGIVSNWCPPNDGYRGLSAKSMDWLASEVYQPALPTHSLGEGIRAALPGDTLAVRLRASEPINWDGVEATLRWEGGEISTVETVVIEGSGGTDGWVVAKPDPVWTADSVIRFEVTFTTITGTPQDPVTYEFHVLEVLPADSVAALDGAAGNPFIVAPSGPFEESQSVTVTLPAGNGDVDVYYYVSDGPAAGWHPASEVVGLLDGESSDFGNGTCQLRVRHGGTLCLGPAVAPLEPSSLGYSRELTGRVLVAAILAILLAVARIRLARTESRT